MWYFSNRQVAQSLRLSGVSQVGRVEYSTASTFRKRSSVVSAKLAALGGVSFFRPQSRGPLRLFHVVLPSGAHTAFTSKSIS